MFADRSERSRSRALSTETPTPPLTLGLLRRLGGFLKPHLGKLALALIALLASSGLGLVFPLACVLCRTAGRESFCSACREAVLEDRAESCPACGSGVGPFSVYQGEERSARHVRHEDHRPHHHPDGGEGTRRGRLSGSGELLWRPAGGRYSLRLEGSVVGLNVLTQESTGTLEPHGLVPERFTDQRARRPMVAANFEREAGRIRFSGPSTELPWQAGVQDRLSWMMQLAGVAEAEPQHLAAGERIVMQVVGARGDASIWAFRSLGPEPLAMFGESLATVHLLREPRHPYDTRVEVWLDPARHHLPVRATMGSGDEDRLELRLREAIP